MVLKYGSLALLLAALLTGCGGSAESVFGGGNDDTGEDGDLGESPDLSCSAPVVAIKDIKNLTIAVGETVNVKGVVHAEFLGDKRLDGFYLQALKEHFDDNSKVSQGLFVHTPKTTGVRIGHELIVRGVVQEHHGQLRLAELEEIAACKTGSPIIYSDIKFPLESLADIAAYEDMAVYVAGASVVTDNAQLALEGALTLATEVLRQPTEVVAPGAEAARYAERYELMRIILDDGSDVLNPESVIYPSPELLASNSVRIGDRALTLQGVLVKKEGAYRLQPTQVPSFEASNARPAKPAVLTKAEQEAKGEEAPPRDAKQLRIATVNLWQYQPGTHSFSRQRPKITALFNGLDADIYAVQELNNDGTGPSSTVVDLIDTLNASQEGTPYQFVQFATETLGVGALTNTLIYRSDRVAEAGTAASLATGAFNGELHQPVVAQTFIHKQSGKKLTLVGNQFVSRICTATSADSQLLRDHQDGQACASMARREAAAELLNWLALQPTGQTAPVVIAGDFNAYSLEDPIRFIKQANYFNAAEQFVENGYTHVEQGMVGSLDHIFIPKQLENAVVAVDTWKVSADEPIALNYETRGKSDRHQATWYNTQVYRAVERNPVVVRFDTELLQ